MVRSAARSCITHTAFQDAGIEEPQFQPVLMTSIKGFIHKVESAEHVRRRWMDLMMHDHITHIFAKLTYF